MKSNYWPSRSLLLQTTGKCSAFIRPKLYSAQRRHSERPLVRTPQLRSSSASMGCCSTSSYEYITLKLVATLSLIRTPLFCLPLSFTIEPAFRRAVAVFDQDFLSIPTYTTYPLPVADGTMDQMAGAFARESPILGASV